MPALTVPAIATGTTVSGLGLTTLIKKIGGLSVQMGTEETTDVSTTGFRKLIKKAIADNPKLTIECYWTGAAITLGASGTFTITWPLAGSFAGTGIVTNVKYPDAENGVVMMGSYEVTYDGYTGPAFTAA